MAKPDYVSIDDLETVLPEIEQAKATDDSTSRKVDNLTRNDSIIKEHLRFAESKVESYLVEYTVPLSDPPHSVRWAVLVIASYMLMLRSDMNVSEQTREMYDSVVNWLNMVRQGKATIPNVSTMPNDFVGFGDKSDMKYDHFPYSDFASTYVL
jgi:phage gp36-like protein